MRPARAWLAELVSVFLRLEVSQGGALVRGDEEKRKGAAAAGTASAAAAGSASAAAPASRGAGGPAGAGASATNPYALFAVVVLASAMGNLSQTGLNAMLGDVVAEFGMGVDVGQWLTTGYMLMLGVTVPAVAFVQRRFALRTHVVAACACFIVGAVFALVASSFWVIFAGRLLQAVSAGLLFPLMQTIAMTRFPRGRQATAMGVGGIAMGFAPNIGPTVGGALSTAFGWRSFFVLLIALMAAILLASLALVRRDAAADASARLDVASLALSATGLGALLLGLSNASSFSLASPFVWAPVLVGAAVLAVFARRQLRLARQGDQPLVDLGIVRSRRFNHGTVALALLYASFMGVTLIVPLYVQNVCGGTALDAGLVLLPGTVVALVANPLAGVMADRVGARRVTLVTGFALALGAAGMMFADASTPYWVTAAFQCVRQVGVSGLIGPLTSWSLEGLAGGLVAHGSSASLVVRQAAASLGTSLMVLATSAVAATGALAAYPALPYQAALGVSAAFSLAAFAYIAAFVRARKTV